MSRIRFLGLGLGEVTGNMIGLKEACLYGSVDLLL